MTESEALGAPRAGEPHTTAAPRRWRRILCEGSPDRLVFACYYKEFADSFEDSATHECFEERPMKSTELLVETLPAGTPSSAATDAPAAWEGGTCGTASLPVVDLRPVDLEWMDSGDWGEDEAFIRCWFDEGEALADMPLSPDAAPRGDRWEKARDFMRSLAVSAHLLPA